MFVFGRDPPVGVEVAWGARAILSRGLVDLVHDRMQMTGNDEGDRKKLLAWIDKHGLPKLRKRMDKHYVDRGGSEIIVIEHDGYHLEASAQCSHGYLYIGAWRLPVAVTHEDDSGKVSKITVVHRCATIAEAEAFIAALPNQGDVEAGRYGIDAPELMVNPPRATAGA